MARTSSPTSTPVGAAADAGEAEQEKPSKGATFHKTMEEHHAKIHKHLAAAHAAAPESARRHINQAGMAATALHKTAKEAANSAGNVDDSNEYDMGKAGQYNGR